MRINNFANNFLNEDNKIKNNKKNDNKKKSIKILNSNNIEESNNKIIKISIQFISKSAAHYFNFRRLPIISKKYRDKIDFNSIHF